MHTAAEPAADVKPPLEKQPVNQAPTSTAAKQAPQDGKAEPGGQPAGDMAAIAPTDVMAQPAAVQRQAPSDPELHSFLSHISAEEAAAEAEEEEEGDEELSDSSLDSCKVWRYRNEWRRNEKAKHYHSCDEDWKEGMESDEETFDDYIARLRGRGARRSGWCE